MVWPVTMAEASEASQIAVPTRSSLSRLRWIDWPEAMTSRAFSYFSPMNSIVPSVSTAEGAMALTRMRSRPSSRASPRVRPITAALDTV